MDCIFYNPINHTCNKYPEEDGYINYCVEGPCPNFIQKKMTRFEKIRSMSIEEMADVILKEDGINSEYSHKYCHSDCAEEDGCPHEKECILKWLNEDTNELEKGLSYRYDYKTDTYVVRDNSTGEEWTEEFDTKAECISWLRREFEVGDRDDAKNRNRKIGAKGQKSIT